MLGDILKYLFGVLMRKPKFARAVASARLRFLKLFATAYSHPALSISILAPLLVIFIAVGFMYPEILPQFIQPSKKCYFANLSDDQLYTKRGDQLKFSIERPCLHGQVVAIEYFDWGSMVVKTTTAPKPNDIKFQNLVAAHLLINSSVESVDNTPNEFDEWNLYTIFEKNDQFSFVINKGNSHYSGSFPISNTTQGNTIPGNFDNTQVMRGFILTGQQKRPSQYHSLEKKLYCNHGTPNASGFTDCEYWTIETFIPSTYPRVLCATPSIWDRWFAGSPRKVVLAQDLANLDAMARDRWVLNKPREIPKGTWTALSESMPSIYMRWLGVNGETLNGRYSNWTMLGSIGAVWCDP
jgi:hypothetical protein